MNEPEFLTNPSDVARWLASHRITKDYEFAPDGSVRLTGYYNALIHKGDRAKPRLVPTLRVRFTESCGGFSASGLGLTSGAGLPNVMNGTSLALSHNRLASFAVIPPITATAANFLVYLQHNRFTSLAGIHKTFPRARLILLHHNPITSHLLGLCLIKGLARVDVGQYSQIDSWVETPLMRAVTALKPYFGCGRAAMLEAQRMLLDLGLDDFAQL